VGDRGLPERLAGRVLTSASRARRIDPGNVCSRIRVIPNTAHMTMLESPTAFNTTVLDFLATLNS
jgi:pimeloyl-ACP methyl ester carboxylesterase